MTVTDASGCSETASVEVCAGNEITATVETIDATCFGENDGEVVVTAGAIGNFGNFDGNNYGQGNDFDDLLAGTYTFFAQDENGCVQTVDATIGEPEAIVVTGIVSEGSVTGESSPST